VDYRLKTFAAEATGRCTFLISEYGFAGPEINRTEQGVPEVSVRYTRGDVVVETSLVLYYMGEEYVTTWLADHDAAGAQQRRTVGTDTAHKGHQMRKALDRQVGALRELLGTIDRQH
jgi:hypothetical protein